MPVLKKLSLRNSATELNKWETVAPGVRMLRLLPREQRSFNGDIATFAENPADLDTLTARLGADPNRFSAPPVLFCELDNGFISPRLKNKPRYWLFGNDRVYLDDFTFSGWQDSIPDGVNFKDLLNSEHASISFEQTVHVNQPVLFLNVFWNTNHLLHETLPALLYLSDVMKAHPEYAIYSSPIKTPAVKRFLKEIGFPLHRVIEVRDITITAPKVVVSYFACGGHLNTPTQAFDRTCDLLMDTVLRVHPVHELPRKIFVSRADASQRRLLNEAEVIDYLVSEHAFKVVVPGSLSIAEQIEYFSNASAIVGPHGMGMNNVAFARAPRLVMELFQPNWIREAYLRQAQIKGSAYAAYIGKTVDGHLSVDMASFVPFFEECAPLIEGRQRKKSAA